MRKSQVFILSLLLSLNVFAGAGGHGGDPFEIYAEAYPDQQKLEEAISHAKEKVTSSSLPEEIEQKILNEISALADAGRYLYLESLIIVEQEGKDTYKLPRDAHSFISLGAMTGTKLGDAIYLSKRTLSYEVSRLSELLIHEVLHHTYSESLSGDEEFIKKMTTAIVTNSQIDKAMIFAFENGLYLGEKTIAPDQFFDYLVKVYDTQGKCQEWKEFYKEKSIKQSIEKECLEELAEMKTEFVKTHSSIMDHDFKQVVKDFILIAYYNESWENTRFSYLFDNTHGHFREVWKNYIRAIIKAFSDSGLPVKLRQYPRYGSEYCKRRVSGWFYTFNGCGKNNELLMSDLF